MSDARSVSPDVRPVCWLDGRIRPIEQAAIRADDLAFTEGRGCYTTALIRGGKARFADRHLRRLTRGAAALNLGQVDPHSVMHCFRDLARAALPDGSGIIRLQVSRDPTGATHLVGLPRALGNQPPTWTAITAPLHHEGPIVPGGHKLTNRVVLALAADAKTRAGADEALLYDAEGHLVEGVRSNIVLVDAQGSFATPPLSRGPVAGIAREIAMALLPELRERDLYAGDVATAQEVLAINSVRGARPIVLLDGRAVGRADGPGLERLSELLERD